MGLHLKKLTHQVPIRDSARTHTVVRDRCLIWASLSKKQQWQKKWQQKRIYGKDTGISLNLSKSWPTNYSRLLYRAENKASNYPNMLCYTVRLHSTYPAGMKSLREICWCANHSAAINSLWRAQTLGIWGCTQSEGLGWAWQPRLGVSSLVGHFWIPLVQPWSDPTSL